MKQYKVGLVGIGAVGTEMVKVLRQRKFPASEIRILATRERDEEVAGETFHVLEAKPEAFDGLDIVLFAGTEGSKGASKQYGWEAVKRGAVVIDNGDDYRM
ncbi:MAG: aspartate-semialdehyde dehydrogenase, partial [Lentisphaerae bacterium]|nr:aspartate-semialdehyde dehydrogenase [Lentisphaerota bacterium]